MRTAQSQREMTITRVSSFHCEVEESKNRDDLGNRVTIVKCHGRLVSETVWEIKVAVNSLIANGGRIIMDLSDVVLAQPEMEQRRSPLVSIPPFGRGFSRHVGLSSDNCFCKRAEREKNLPRC